MTTGLIDVGPNVAILMGSTIVAASGTPPPPVQNAPIKFNPGDFIQTDGVTADATNAQFQLEMNTVANDTHKTFAGYLAWWKWRDFENTTQGVYDFSLVDGVLNYFVNAMALKGRFGLLGIGIAAYKNSSLTVADLSNSKPGAVPNYIINGSSSTFGPGPPTSSFPGWWAQNYNGTTFGFTRANTCNANVQNAYNALWAALAAHQVTMTAGPFTGQTFTIDACPHVAFVADYGPDDIAMHSNPSNTTPSNYTTQQFYVGWFSQMSAMSAAFPHTFTLMMPGFGPDGPGGNSAANEANVLAAMFNSRMAISSTDTFANQPSLSYAQQTAIGNSYNVNTLVQGGGTDYRPLALMAPTAQAPDYSRSTGTYASTSIPLVAGGMADIFKLLASQYRIWTICSNAAVVPGDFNSFIQPGVQQAQAAGNNAVTLIPPAYMVAPAGLQSTSITNTSVTLTWNTVSGIGTGITYTVYIGGSPAVGGTGIFSPPATIGGLNPLTTYSFTVATVNSYGAGPQSAPLSVETT